MWLVALLAALVAGLEGTARAVLPLAVAASAAIAVIGLAAAVWLGPMLLAGLWIVSRRPGADVRGVALVAAAFAAFLCVLSVPTLLDSGEYVDVAAKVVTTESELGNLFRPLKLAQVAGIWLTGDFRLTPAPTCRCALRAPVPGFVHVPVMTGGPPVSGPRVQARSREIVPPCGRAMRS